MSIKKVLKRKAFTMIELVMVIVILGIVGMIGADIIAKMYQGYIKTKIVNDLQQKTELLVEQISKRFQYRIKETTIARNSDATSANYNKYKLLNSADVSTISPDMVEWIGYDYESFIGESNGTYSIPGWSGFIDVNSTQTDKKQVLTPRSNLRITERVITTLSYDDVNISKSFAAKDHPIIIPRCQKDSNLSLYGWDIPTIMPVENNSTFIIKKNNVNNILDFRYANIKPICEQYYLAWSAYALVPVGDKDDFNLTLRYSYQPWEGESYQDNINKKGGTQSSVLAEHLSTFKVLQIGDSIRIKVCIHDENVTGTMYGFCKEKVVF